MLIRGWIPDTANRKSSSTANKRERYLLLMSVYTENAASQSQVEAKGKSTSIASLESSAYSVSTASQNSDSVVESNSVFKVRSLERSRRASC